MQRESEERCENGNRSSCLIEPSNETWNDGNERSVASIETAMGGLEKLFPDPPMARHRTPLILGGPVAARKNVPANAQILPPFCFSDFLGP
jgi:hypothetical protein